MMVLMKQYEMILQQFCCGLRIFFGEEDFEDILKITLSLKFEDIKMNKKENKGLRIFIDAINKVAEQIGDNGKNN